MASIDETYEREHARSLLEAQKQLELLYSEAIDRIYVYAVSLQVKDVFTITDYPALNAAMDRELALLAQRTEVLVRNGVSKSFDLSQKKFGATVNATYYRNTTMPEVMRELVNRPQAKAMEAFLSRLTGPNRLGLSDRIWKYANEQIRAEIENNLFAGIAEGKSAAEMARDQKKYLKDPDALFRRVRNSKGKLVLSKAAKAFNPGQGVYRSAYKNALRVTATEINMAYRKADGERWKATPFVLGYKINLSQRHPKFDICDHLAGHIYPVDFDWTGWHPRCMCNKTPVLPSMEEFKQYQQALLRGEGDKFRFRNVTKDVPVAFKGYISANQERISGWKQLPYWMANNRKFTAVAGEM